MVSALSAAKSAAVRGRRCSASSGSRLKAGKKQPRPSRRKTAARTARSLALLATVSAMAPLLAPQSSPLQKAASSKPRPPVPNVCVVTGGTGFVGQRLVEMLVERGAKKVISLDIVPPPKDAWQHPASTGASATSPIKGVCGDKGADCVLAQRRRRGPLPPAFISRVNYEGAERPGCVPEARPKLVFSSSPSTRFTGPTSMVEGGRDTALPLSPTSREYARRRRGGARRRAACCDELMTVGGSADQVYSPRNHSCELIGGGWKVESLRQGFNRICFTHVDNYATVL